MKFENEYIVGVEDIGRDNKMTNYAFLRFLEEIGSTHSATIGYGVNDIEETKKVWIVMDWKVQILKRPKYGDKIKIKTWARPISRRNFYTYRDFEVFLGEEKVAIATSKWVLFDIQKNKISKLSDDIIGLYNPDEGNVFNEEEIEKLTEKEEQNLTLKYKVRRFDIDINKHVHNLNYLKIAYESLPEDKYFEDEKNNIRIMYKHQIILGDEVNCYYTNEGEKEIVTIKDKNDKILHSIIELYN